MIPYDILQQMDSDITSPTVERSKTKGEGAGGGGEPTTNVNRSGELGCYAACVWNNVEV